MGFRKGQIVKHVKTNTDYIVSDVPRKNIKLEHSNETFYAYQELKGATLWLRGKSEMEDGRFLLLATKL